MKQYALTLKAATPLMVGEGGYIPGSTLLGAFAQAYLRNHENDALFDRLFLQNKLWFGNAYPANFKYLQHSGNLVKPLPATARSCKRWGGFLYKAKEDVFNGKEERHGVRDHLFLWALFALSGKLEILKTPKNESCQCNLQRLNPRGNAHSCQEQLDRFDGFYRLDASKHGEIAHTDRRLVTGTGINRERGTVEDAILYNLEVVPEDSKFQAMFRVDAAIENDVTVFFADPGLHLRVGQAKSRGMGKLEYTENFQEARAMTVETFIETRLKQFNTAFQQRAKEYGVNTDDAFFFALTCCSDVIMQADDLRYRTSLEDAYMEEILGVKGIHLVYQNASTTKIKGWNALWRLPRAIESGIRKGSVFFFRYTGAEQAQLFQRLYDLECDGLGNRQPEGFGWVSVSDNFHWEVNEL